MLQGDSEEADKASKIQFYPEVPKSKQRKLDRLRPTQNDDPLFMVKGDPDQAEDEHEEDKRDGS